MTPEELRRCRETCLGDCDPAGLAALSELSVDAALPREQRLQAVLGQLGNPYLFRAGGLTVQVRFTGQRSLTEAVASALAFS